MQTAATKTDPPPIPFGHLLRQHRMAAALSQEALAERAGLSAAAISVLERGKREAPRLETVALLADALALAVVDRAAFIAASRATSASLTPPPAPHPMGSFPTAPEPPFVGRARELALLQQHLTGEGPPLLLFAGEPGIGKTRLLHAAYSQAHALGLQILEGGCQRRGGQEPYAPLLSALQRYLSSRRLGQLRTELQGCAWLVRLLPELADGPIEPLPARTLSPEQERRLMFGAVVRFLTNLAGSRGLLLVLDDLQWAGPDALDLLMTVVRATADVPLRLLGAYRTTEVPAGSPLYDLLADLAHGGLVTQHTMTPLSREETGRLLDYLLAGGSSLAPHVREQALRRSSGVPFFAVSCAQGLLLETGTQSGQPGVPWDVAQSVRQRVAALPKAAQELLGAAAIFGREVSHTQLTAVAQRSEAEVIEGLEIMCHVRLLEEVAAAGYQFAHDVIREVVEADLGGARRQVLHRRIAEHLEAQARRGARSATEVIAYHYAQTAEDAKAASWLERAGDIAVAEVALNTALAHYTAAVERLTASTAHNRAAALSRLAEKIADVHMRRGAHAQARDHLAHARAHVTSPVRRAALWYREGMTYRFTDEAGPALAAFATAEAEGGPNANAGVLPARLRAVLALGRASVHFEIKDDLAMVGACADEAIRLFADDSAASVTASASAPGAAETMLMPDDEPLPLTPYEGIVAPEASLGYALLLRGWVAAWDNPAQAEVCYDQSLHCYDREGDASGRALVLLYRGTAADDHGDLTRAEEDFQRVLGLNEEVTPMLLAAAWQGLSRVCMGRGDLDRAEECVRHCLALSEPVGHRVSQAYAYESLGRVAQIRGELGRAEECFQQSLALFDKIGSPQGCALAWLGIGNVRCVRGDLTTAARWCRIARRQARRVRDTNREAEAAVSLARVLLHARQPRVATLYLEYGATLARRHGWAQPTIQAALLTIEMRLSQGVLAGAMAAAEDALRLAAERGRRLEEGIARRLLGQCLLAGGEPIRAEVHLRTALDQLEGYGAALEAARTRLALATALAMAAGAECIPAESYTLLSDAQAQFVRSDADLDLAQSQTMAAIWGRRIAPDKEVMADVAVKARIPARSAAEARSGCDGRAADMPM